MKAIPIKEARSICELYKAPIVIIFAIDPATGKQHITTYGDTIPHCAAAARGGNDMKKHLGWPEALCNAIPARIKRKDATVEKSLTCHDTWHNGYAPDGARCPTCSSEW